MKKIIKLMIIVMVMMTGVQVSYGQNFTALFGTWRPSTPSNLSQYTNITFVNIISNNQAKISDVNNNHVVFNLKSIANGGLETVLPFELKKLYGYDAKKVFVRLYNQNNKLRVVRKIYEYDRNGVLLNANPTLDSILFEKAVINKSLDFPNTPKNVDVIKPVDPRIAGDFKERKEFFSGTKYKIEFLAIQNIKGDRDNINTDKEDKELELEILGKIDCTVKNAQNNTILPQKSIFSNSNSVGNSYMLNKNNPIVLNNIIEFTVPQDKIAEHYLVLNGELLEQHKFVVVGEFNRIQGFYLKNRDGVKAEIFKFSDANPGENTITINLRKERDGDGEDTTLGLKIRITKIN